MEGLRLLDLSKDPSLPALLDFLRRLTRAQDSGAALNAVIKRYSLLKPCSQFMGVVPDDSGGYRISFSVAAGEEVAGSRQERLSRLGTVPLHRGGFIGDMIKDPSPKVAINLELRADPVLGDSMAHTRSCLAFPVFEGDEVLEWALGFSPSDEGFSANEVGQHGLTVNLLGVVSRRLDAANTIQRLNRQLRDQLDQLARVQQSLLPSRTPEIPALEISTSYLTSIESGGDYYDFFRLPGERWAILIADVSGHGAAAATVMAMLHAILHCYAPLNPSADFNPAEIMKFANNRLVEAGLDGSFITAFLGIYDPAAGKLVYTNAGHNPPRHKHGLSGRISAIDGAGTLPLGILEPYEATTAELQFSVNDTLILYTDGITEAFGPGGEMFGTARLDEALEKCSGQPDCIVDSVHKALFTHRGSATRDDDQTIVAVRYHGLCRIDQPAR
jgi:phosphoserine phosphatase RsbU/P